MSQAHPVAPAPAALPPRVVLFDGVCVFCNRSVDWIARRDPDARFHFAPLQGETAAALRARHPEIPYELATMVYVEAGPDGERVSMRSGAFFRMARDLPGAWRHAAKLGVLPRALTDFVYFLVVRWRYAIFGKLDACRVPTPDERSRFLP